MVLFFPSHCCASWSSAFLETVNTCLPMGSSKIFLFFLILISTADLSHFHPFDSLSHPATGCVGLAATQVKPHHTLYMPFTWTNTAGLQFFNWVHVIDLLKPTHRIFTGILHANKVFVTHSTLHAIFLHNWMIWIVPSNPNHSMILWFLWFCISLQRDAEKQHMLTLKTKKSRLRTVNYFNVDLFVWVSW